MATGGGAWAAAGACAAAMQNSPQTPSFNADNAILTRTGMAKLATSENEASPYNSPGRLRNPGKSGRRTAGPRYWSRSGKSWV